MAFRSRRRTESDLFPGAYGVKQRKQITENGVQVYDSRISYTERIAGTGSFAKS